jgi:drug/metabolite transporter (DMT)-like permease
VKTTTPTGPATPTGPTTPTSPATPFFPAQTSTATWDLTGALLCTIGMTILGSSVAVSRLILDYPTLTGQALRYAVAAAILSTLLAAFPGAARLGTARPEATRHEAGQLGADRPGTTRPEATRHEAGQLGADRPGTTRLAAGRLGTARLGAGHPGIGHPGIGHPGIGHPGAGRLGIGNPGAGNPGAGNPGAGNPGAARLGAARLGTTRPGRARLWPSRGEFVRLVALAGTGLAGFNVCVLTALRHADAAIVGTVIGAAPLGLAIAGPLLRGERPASRIVGAATVVVLGAAIVHGGGHADTLGMLAALGALAGEVAFSLLAAAVLPRLGAVRVTTWSCTLAVPMLLIAAVPAGELSRWRPPTATEAGTLAYLAVVLTVITFLIWYAGLMRLGVERAGMFVGLLPVTTLLTAAVQDARLPAPAQGAGVVVVALGLAAGLTSPRPTNMDRGSQYPSTTNCDP